MIPKILILVVVLAGTTFSQSPTTDEIDPKLTLELEKITSIYQQKCFMNSNADGLHKIFTALTSSSMCVSIQSSSALTTQDFCNTYGKQFINCLKNFADAGKGCLDKNEKYLPDFILNGQSRVLDKFCKGNSADHITKIMNSKCKKPLEQALNNDFLEVCVPKLKIIANLDKKDYSLNQHDVCSDLKTAQECVVNSIKTNCEVAKADLDFISSIFQEYRAQCNFSNINAASFVLLAVVFLLLRGPEELSFVLKMSTKRKKPSGSEFRKSAKLIKEKNELSISTPRKLDSFFLLNEHKTAHGSETSTTDSPASPVDSSQSLEVAPVEITQDVNTPNYECRNELASSTSGVFTTDPADWDINNQTIDFVAMNGFLQNSDGDFSASKRTFDGVTRYLNKSLFFRITMHSEIIFVITLLSTVYSQKANTGLPPDLQHKLERLSFNYLEKCRRNVNENASKNFKAALETVPTCISKHPEKARSALEFYNFYGTQFLGCLKNLADVGKGCLDQDEKYLPDFILNGTSRVLESRKNDMYRIEFLVRKSEMCLTEVEIFDVLTVCVSKLKIFAGLDNINYSLNQADVCSDLKTSQECLVNNLKKYCVLAMAEFEFVNSVFEEFRSECNFANNNVASFILLAILLLSSNLGSVQLTLKVDEVEAEVKVCVVRDSLQEVPILIGRNFTELPKVLMIKDDKILKFVKSDTKPIQDIEVEPPIRKIVLRVRKETTVPHDHLANVQVYCKDYKGDLFVEARVCLKEGQEYLLPNTVLRVSTDGVIAIPCINLSDGNLNFHQDTIFARAWPCFKQRNDSIPKEFDRMRPWIPVGGVSSGESEESSDEEGVVLSDPDEPDVSHREAR
ncbi:hypothetical protein RN001_000207 [Aquatica leii]|uniref:Uncharacterized protein n=1 Tax=Aquatica leii TaxID=1421715 RepID=A0AAN7SC37_9COLE|nr:hypothetical protein RN001_000207 [Aquatica leii]